MFSFFPLVFLSNSGPNVASVAFGMFRLKGRFLPTSAKPKNTIIVWLPSVFLLFRAVTVCIMCSLSSVGFCQFCFSTDHHGDLQRISC